MSESLKPTDPAGSPPHPTSTKPRRNTALIVIAATVMLAVAVATIISSFGLGYWTTLGPGPGFFPFWIGVLLATSSSVWLIQALRGNPNVGVTDTAEEITPDAEVEDKVVESRGRNLPLWSILLVLVVTATLLNVIGFQLSMFAFLLFMLKFQGGRGWLMSLVISIAGSFGVYYLFTVALQVTLPVASIEFLRMMGM